MSKWTEAHAWNQTRTWLRHLVLSGVILALMSGCGEGYRVEPARLNILCNSDAFTEQQVFEFVFQLLRKENFEYLGRYDQMIALIQHSDSFPAKARETELARLNRERTFLDDSHHLRIVWTDYTDIAPADAARLSYKPASTPSIEIDIYEERPGGFSAAGLRFYRNFLSDLTKSAYGASVFVVSEPPPTDESEYRRITIINDCSIVVWAAIACLLTLSLTGASSKFVLKRLRVPLILKRGVFVLVNTWLVAPIPFHGDIFVVMVPNLALFPWTDLNYYVQVAGFAAVSVPCALLLCTGASFFYLKGSADVRSPASA